MNQRKVQLPTRLTKNKILMNFQKVFFLTCFPVHNLIGQIIAGGGNLIFLWFISVMSRSVAEIRWTSLCVKNVSFLVSKWLAVIKSKKKFKNFYIKNLKKSQLPWIAAIKGCPARGLTKLCLTPIRSDDSAFASYVCGKCTFISSPSKSALYGVQAHSLNLMLHK